MTKNKEVKTFTTALGIFTNWYEMAENVWAVQPIYYDMGKNWWLWDWNDNRWYMCDETEIMNYVDKALASNFTIIPMYKNLILESLRRIGRKNKPKDIEPTWIQFKNKIVDIKTGDIIEPNPKYFCTNPLPYEYNTCGKTPTLDKLFIEWVGEEYKELLYEIIAYSMLPSYPLGRIFCFVGGGSNGKSCYLEILSKFIGKYNVCSTELDSLIKRPFEAGKLYRKLVCLMGETNFNRLENTSIIKKITGRDLMSIEFKNKTPFDAVNYAKLIIATNSLPITTDMTDGFYRRWVIVDFPNRFSEKIDILSSVPQEEFHNLGCKCVELLRKIIEKREFSKEGSIEDRKKRYEDRSNPLKKFIKECCVENVNTEIPFFRFYDHFSVFLERNNFRKMSKSSVGRTLRDLGFDIEKKTINKVNGDGQTSWKYIIGLSFGEKLSDFGTDGTNGTHFQLQSQYREMNLKPGTISTIGTKINHTCISCGTFPSNIFGINGKPYCKECYDHLIKIGQLKPKEEMIE